VMRKSFLLLLAFLTLGFFTGCNQVVRVVEFHSKYPGAHVVMDDSEVGIISADPTRPLTTTFTFYGNHDFYFFFDVGKESEQKYQNETGTIKRFRHVHIRKNIPTPWYEWPPMDFFVEAFSPVTIGKPVVIDVDFEATSVDAALEGDDLDRKAFKVLLGRDPEPGERIGGDNLEVYALKAEKMTSEDRELGKAGAMGFRAEGKDPVDPQAQPAPNHNISIILIAGIIGAAALGLLNVTK